jgi:HK97 family phage prohead protease
MNVIRKVTSSSVRRSTGDLFTFACSSELPDRYHDIVVQRGISWKSYLLNNIALLNHDHNSAIGNFLNLRLENNQLTADLKLAPEGTSPRIDEIRKLVSAGVLKAVSIGFFGTKTEPIIVNGNRTGTRYLESELCEISLVAVGANREAVAIAKTLGISEGTQQMIFKQNEEISPAERLRRTRRSIARVKHNIETTTSPTTRATLRRSLAILERFENEERAALQLPANRSTSQARTRPYTAVEMARVQAQARALVGPMTVARYDQKRAKAESDARFAAAAKASEDAWQLAKQIEQETQDAELRRLFGKDDVETKRYDWGDGIPTWRGVKIKRGWRE